MSVRDGVKTCKGALLRLLKGAGCQGLARVAQLILPLLLVLSPGAQANEPSIGMAEASSSAGFEHPKTDTSPLVEHGSSSSQCRVAPNWILTTTQGENLSLYDMAAAGKTTVMIFWSTWCKNCKDLLPQLNHLLQSKPSSHLSVVLMNVWEDGDPVVYLKEQQVAFPLVLRAEHVAQRYDIKVTPGVVVVDEHKQVQYNRPVDHQVSDVVAWVDHWLESNNR